MTTRTERGQYPNVKVSQATLWRVHHETNLHRDYLLLLAIAGHDVGEKRSGSQIPDPAALNAVPPVPAVHAAPSASQQHPAQRVASQTLYQQPAVLGKDPYSIPGIPSEQLVPKGSERRERKHEQRERWGDLPAPDELQTQTKAVSLDPKKKPSAAKEKSPAARGSGGAPSSVSSSSSVKDAPTPSPAPQKKGKGGKGGKEPIKEWKSVPQSLTGINAGCIKLMGTARFFVIKSYNLDDVHKSVKYGIWTSTPRGNAKLNDAFVDFHQEGPVFLYFSVNGSRQFCGVAELRSALDHSSTATCWTKSVFQGVFLVRWLIVKDVPNNMFQHITNEMNDNKTVAHSRDTQEIPMLAGVQMLDVFNQYEARQSMLAKFEHYDKMESNGQDKA